MKTIIIILSIVILNAPVNTEAQSAEAQQLLLNVEKLAQLKNILNNMYKGYEIVSRGYTKIKDLSKGNFDLHDLFLKKLLDVNPTVRRYKKVSDILSCQANIVQEYRSTYSRLRNSNLLNNGELRYISSVYDKLFKKSLQNLDELTMVMTAGKLRMTDDERLSAIDRIFKDIQDKLTFLRVFNRENSLLVLQRGREMVDTRISKKMNGL